MMKVMDINITVNGEQITLDRPLSVDALLVSQGYTEKLVAVAVNGSFVARESHAAHMIADRDEIDIVAPMQGG